MLVQPPQAATAEVRLLPGQEEAAATVRLWTNDVSLEMLYRALLEAFAKIDLHTARLRHLSSEGRIVAGGMQNAGEQLMTHDDTTPYTQDEMQLIAQRSLLHSKSVLLLVEQLGTESAALGPLTHELGRLTTIVQQALQNSPQPSPGDPH